MVNRHKASKIALTLLVVLLATITSCGETEVIGTPLPPAGEAVDAEVAPRAGESRDNPLPVGFTARAKGGGGLTYDIAIIEVLRGDLAWNMIRQANQFNEPAGSEKEYLLVMVRLTYIDGPREDPESVNILNFDLFSGDGRKYDIPFVVEPEPQLDYTLFPGANPVEGWLAWEVEVQDSAPVLRFLANIFDQKGLWLATTE